MILFEAETLTVWVGLGPKVVWRAVADRAVERDAFLSFRLPPLS